MKRDDEISHALLYGRVDMRVNCKLRSEELCNDVKYGEIADNSK